MKPITLFIIFCLCGPALMAQQDGTVIDALNAEPISGASIVFSDESVQITDTQGHFTYAQDNLPIRISHVGYQTVAAPAGLSGNPLVISLSAGSINLEEVVVTAFHGNRKLLTSPGPVALISKKELNRDHDVIITNPLNRIPGIFMHSGALNTNRITIRGIGTRAPFSTNRVKGYLNEIPLSTGEGETTLEDIDLAIVDRVEVIRGPASSEFGAGLGGVINLKASAVADQPVTIKTDNQVGGYYGYSRPSGGVLADNPGWFRSATSANLNLGSGNLKMVYSKMHSDGYRENNEYDRQSFTTLANIRSSDNSRLTFLFNLVDLKAFIPSSLDSATFQDNPQAAAGSWLGAQGFEDYTKVLAGAALDHRFSDDLQFTGSVFTNFRNANEVRPFNILRETTAGYGLRGKLLWGVSDEVTLSGGGEYFRDNYRPSELANNNSLPGDLLSSSDITRSYYNAFLQGEWRPIDRLLVFAGININQTSYSFVDIFLANGDQSDNIDFRTTASPRIALNYELDPHNSLHFSVSHGFSPPTLDEMLDIEQTINPDIDPETGFNYELGGRGSLLEGRLAYDLSIFTMRIRNLLVAQQLPGDQTIGVNAGKTTHNGVEAAIGYKFIDNPTGFMRQLTGHLTYTLADYSFDEFVNEGNDYSGNELTGTPGNSLNAMLDFNTGLGLYGNFNYRFVDEMPMRDDNSVFSDAYQVTNLKIGYRKGWGPLNLDLYAGVNNLFDERYASMIWINAGSFGGPPRYFYPGQPRSYYTGLSLSLSL